MATLDSIDDAVNAAKHIGLNVNVFEDGDISIDPYIPSMWASFSKQAWHTNVPLFIQCYGDSEIVVIARTEAPPLSEFTLPPDIDLQIQALSSSRYAIIDGVPTLLKLIDIALAHGWSVVSDMYFFPLEGGFLGYLSHHDDESISISRDATSTRR